MISYSKQKKPANNFLWLYGWIFAFYVGTGPIYWFPGVNHEHIYAIKTIAFFIIIGFPLLLNLNESLSSFPGGRSVFILIVCFVFFSIPGIWLGNSEVSTYQIKNILQILLFLYAVGYLLNRGVAGSIIRKVVIVFSVASLLSLCFMVFSPNWISPLNEGLRIVNTGFGGSRTGWSPAVALYLPWLYSTGMFSYFLSILTVLCMLSNQFMTTGRTGMIASFIPFLLWGVIRKSFKVFMLMSLGAGLIIYYVAGNLDRFRLAQGGVATLQGLDDLSTGRIEQYLVALKIIYENPLFGSGFGNAVYYGRSWYIHNTVLRFAAEGGLPLAIIIISLFSLAIFRGYKKTSRGSNASLGALLTVTAGIVASMFEPGFMFGGFNNSVFWWFCFALCVSSKPIELYPSSRA